MLKSLKPGLVLLAKVTVSMGLLAWLAAQVQWPLVWQHMQGLPWVTLPYCVGLYVLAQALSTLRWQKLAGAVGINMPFTTLFGWVMAGMVYNQLLPGTIGGDAYRAWTLARATGQRKTLTSLTVLADRGLGLFIMITVAAGFALLRSVNPVISTTGLASPTFLPVLLSLVGIGFVGMVGLAVLPLAKLPPVWQRWGGWLQPAQAMVNRLGVLVPCLALSVMVQGLMVTIHALLLPQAPIAWVGWAYGCVAVLTLLPISFNGVGLREVGYVALLGASVGADKATALSLLWWLVNALTSSLGLWVVWKTGPSGMMSKDTATVS
jgi:glycosyltransferase 2 family protein